MWNWNTIDTCFISSSWHIKSKGMFAGSCIGVVLLVVLLEALRRSVKEYDRYLIRSNQVKHLISLDTVKTSNPGTAKTGEDGVSVAPLTNDSRSMFNKSSAFPTAVDVVSAAAQPFRPTVPQQAVRALLHVCQFVVAYFVML